MNLPNLLSFLVIFVAMPLNWLATILLWRVARSAPDIRVLRERAIAATALALIVTIFALIFLNNDFVPPPLGFEDTKLLTRGTMLALSIIPPCYWLWLYLRATK